jgi:uncharacterized protein YPO0396
LWRIAGPGSAAARICVAEIASVQQDLGDLGAAIDTLQRLERESLPRRTPDRIEALLERTAPEG